MITKSIAIGYLAIHVLSGPQIRQENLVRVSSAKTSETDAFATRLPRRFTTSKSKSGNIFKSAQGEELMISLLHQAPDELRRSFEAIIVRNQTKGASVATCGRFKGVISTERLGKTSIPAARRTYVSAILTHNSGVLVVSYTSNGVASKGVDTVRQALEHMRFE